MGTAISIGIGFSGRVFSLKNSKEDMSIKLSGTEFVGYNKGHFDNGISNAKQALIKMTTFPFGEN